MPKRHSLEFRCSSTKWHKSSTKQVDLKKINPAWPCLIKHHLNRGGLEVRLIPHLPNSVYSPHIITLLLFSLQLVSMAYYSDLSAPNFHHTAGGVGEYPIINEPSTVDLFYGQALDGFGECWGLPQRDSSLDLSIRLPGEVNFGKHSYNLFTN